MFPNIVGTMMIGGYPLHTSEHNGAFYGTDYGTADYHGQDGRSNVPKKFGIGANRSNAIYGKSSTVQPLSIRTIFIIKY